MTREQALRAAALIKVLEDSRDWKAEFDDPGMKHPFILFTDTCSADNIAGDGERGGWEGGPVLPTDIASEMMGWLIERAKRELAELGIKIEDKE